MRIAKHEQQARPVMRWSTEQVAARDAAQAWSEKLSETFLPWTVSRNPGDAFAARIKTADCGAFSLIHCICDNNRGFRRRTEIGRSPGAYFGVLCVLNGRELLTIRDRQVVLESGNFLIWDSQDEMEYALLGGPMEKATILVPQSALLSVMPHARRLVGQPFNRAAGVENLFFSHMRALVSSMEEMEEDDLNAMGGVTVELLARTTMAALSGRADSQAATLARIQTYIKDHLADPDLSASSIADRCGVSVRYLHALFKLTNQTVGDYIRANRLERCRQELSSGGRYGSITDLAFRWGFHDPSHFSRLFRTAYRQTPREYARAALAACSDLDRDRFRPSQSGA